MLQRGLLWAIGRLAQTRPECLFQTDTYLFPFLESDDAYHRGLAAWALGNLKSNASIPALEQLTEDKNELFLFNELELKSMTVGSMATQALEKI